MANTVNIGDYQYTLNDDTGKAAAVVRDKTKSSYENIPSTITVSGQTYKVIYLVDCFSGCSSLTTAPTIPSGVNTLNKCFSGCSALTTAPTIPSSVTNMASCFANCSSLTTAPAIPSSVNSLQWSFGNCSSLTGNVTINANVATFSLLFYNTQKGIWLTGSSSKLSDYAATSSNNNVYVGEIPLNYSMTIERVVGDGGTVQDPEGLFAHIQLTINWADFTENSLDAITLKNGMASTNPTWYTDAAKTNTITLPNWRPSASTTIHCWLAITSATHVFSVTVADRYHTGVVISFTVPQQFRTMDFLAGGQGVAFGMPATQNGMFINMELAIKEYSNIVKNIYDVFYPVGSYYETNLPSAIPSGQSTPTDADLENLGATWFDPNFAWGGTWALESGGRVHISAGKMANNSTNYWGSDITNLTDGECNFLVGESGGETKHTLDATQMPSHYHNTQAAFSIRAMSYNGGQPVWGGNGTTVSKITGSTPDTITQSSNQFTPYNIQLNKNSDSKGGGEAHNNMQPYIVVNRWHRTA